MLSKQNRTVAKINRLLHLEKCSVIFSTYTSQQRRLVTVWCPSGCLSLLAAWARAADIELRLRCHANLALLMAQREYDTGDAQQCRSRRGAVLVDRRTLVACAVAQAYASQRQHSALLRHTQRRRSVQRTTVAVPRDVRCRIAPCRALETHRATDCHPARQRHQTDVRLNCVTDRQTQRQHTHSQTDTQTDISKPATCRCI